MAYDEGLAQIVREKLEETPGYSEKKMFGGLCYLINGNMACGIVSSQLMARIPKEEYEEALDQNHVSEMDFTGRAMRGMIYIDEEGCLKEDILDHWVTKSRKHAASLPPK